MRQHRFQYLCLVQKKGVHLCSACRLVAYCSKECSVAHWSTHKRDCNDTLRSPAWSPAWVREARLPDFIDSGEHASGWASQTPFGLGQHLWGNVPAMDVLNLQNNEGIKTHQDVSVAFIASGDLRNVLTTVNNLPDSYDGHLQIVLNDRSGFITFATSFYFCSLEQFQTKRNQQSWRCMLGIRPPCPLKATSTASKF